MARDNKIFGNEIMVKLGDKEGGRERQELRVNNKSIKILIIHVNYIHFNTWNNVFVIISIDFLCFVMISRNHISSLFFSLKYHVSGDIAFAFIKFICFSNSPSLVNIVCLQPKNKGNASTKQTESRPPLKPVFIVEPFDVSVRETLMRFANSSPVPCFAIVQENWSTRAETNRISFAILTAEKERASMRFKEKKNRVYTHIQCVYIFFF